MDYTLSDQYVLHGPTANRMHQLSAAVPTEVSDKDLNSIIWSMMEVVKAAGLAPKQFDPGDLTTFRVFLESLRSLFVTPEQLAARTMPVGSVVLVLGTSAPAGTYKLNGGLFNRVDDPDLTSYILGCGNVVDDATWLAGRRGSFSTGNGATTMRLANVRGVIPRFFHDGDSTDPDYLTRLMGMLQMSQNLAHSHTQTIFNLDGPNTSYATGFGGGSSGTSAPTSEEGGSEARPINLPFLGCIKR